MKKFLFIFFAILLAINCEDVVEVEIPSEEPRLIIDALMRVDINEPFIPVEVKVSLTDSFFGEIPVTTLESIIILIEFSEDNVVVGNGSSSLAEEEPGSGIYTPDPNFSSDQRIMTSILEENPERDIIFQLILRHEGRVYFASTRYVPIVPIDALEQGDGTLFNGDETEVIVTFTDDPDRDDFYIFDFDFNEFLVTEDEFYQGQEFEFSYFYDRQFESGREIQISILGADEPFYNYMDLLIEQSGDLQGPFQTPVATVRGNIFDITGLDNIDVVDNLDQPNVFPLGYFAIVQEFKRTLTIQ